MPAPPVRYARTSDGVNIGYVDAGEGHPLVFVPAIPFSHVQESWDTWDQVSFAKRFRLVAYDPRGFGLSATPVAVDYSVSAMLRDLEAVSTKAGLGRIAVYSRHGGVPVGLAAAAEWPDRVTHLVCVDGWASFRQPPQEQKESPSAIHRRVVAWHLYEKHMLEKCHWLEGTPRGGSGDLIRLSGHGESPPETPDLFGRALEAVERYDVREVLEKILCPALIVQTRSYGWVPDGAGQEMAARLTRARLLVEDGAGSDGLAELVAQFVASPDAARTTRPITTPTAPLSLREREVLALIAAGKTDAQIAEALTIASATASRHVHNILEKLGMSRRSEAAARWASNGS
jgi:pimeloyl-ACP methyl ester carboxylesterase/DNA-binding CsgD family transcriptional regulator